MTEPPIRPAPLAGRRDRSLLLELLELQARRMFGRGIAELRRNELLLLVARTLDPRAHMPATDDLEREDLT
jgi:hypothetical protein